MTLRIERTHRMHGENCYRTTHTNTSPGIVTTLEKNKRYLEQLGQGSSHLKVKENLDASNYQPKIKTDHGEMNLIKSLGNIPPKNVISSLTTL